MVTCLKQRGYEQPEQGFTIWRAPNPEATYAAPKRQ
jgi:hypothetical protein